MKKFEMRSVFSSLILSVFIILFIFFLWTFGENFIFMLVELVVPATHVYTWWKFALLLGLGVFVAYLAETYGVKRVLPFSVGFLASWFVLSVLAKAFLGVGLMFILVFLIVALTLLMVQIKKLWLIDSELTEKMVALASTGHHLEGKPADLRIESGLKLLETVLPLSEAIVFRYDSNRELTPVGRARNDNSNDSLIARQAAWRENIELCEQALVTRQTVVQTDENNHHSARVALPLIYEGTIVGVLFVKIHQNFELADQNLLEAFSGQLARNFQRKELTAKSLPHKSWWSFLSTHSSENRVDIINLIQSAMKEQSFGALASSYLKEAHAVAYLDGTLAYLNRQMRHLAKLNSDEIYELDLFSLLEQFKTAVFSEPRLAIRRVLQTGENFKAELFFAETNKTLKVQISLVKVPSNEQSIHDTNVPMMPACFLITFRDISAVKENEKLRSDMASLMSHELRTPITSISGFAQLLLMDENIPEDAREFLEIIGTESQRLSKMLSTFLSVSNLEQSDKQEVTKTPVKLDSVVQEVVDDLREMAKKKRIRLVEQANSHLPPVAADKGLITRAVSHLIDNAIKYSPERTSVIISTILESDFLRVVVEDRGYGIPSSEHEKIWQKFYRVAREGQDKEEESTGLGLSLVKEIAEQHGGQVTVESEVGQGSRFSIALPRL
ncbi:MAG TPA: GAF domain-containing sensor histidine kinase [Pyrinomonadaceae bacterium]|jgi:signal transduction histidine kinase